MRFVFAPGLGLGLVCMLAACGQQPGEPATEESPILNGRPSSRRDVLLLATAADDAGCSGTLIAPDVVLTAAHCIGVMDHAYVGFSKAVATGTFAAAPDAGDWTRIRIVEQLAMPGWDIRGCPSIGVDAGLVRLERPVDGAVIARLADAAPEVGEACEVVGYGQHNVGEGERIDESTTYTSGEQRTARLRLFAAARDVDGRGDSEAAWAPLGAGDVAEEVVARGIDGAHSRGDSGGPLFCGGRLAGVVSCSLDRAGPVLELAKAYATVAAARSFIDQTMTRWASGLPNATP